MPITEVLIIRHGTRVDWTLNVATGIYSSTHPYPTGLPADPPLSPDGVEQAIELGVFLSNYLREKAKHDQLRVYSSPFYRCLETLGPTMETLIEAAGDWPTSASSFQVRAERGIGEWFGHAWFVQPKPEETNRLLENFFTWLDPTYQSKMVPPAHGETIASLHDRVAKALAVLISDVDREYSHAGRGNESVTLVLCAHAATVIATGRALTGIVPTDYNQDEFKCYTCGISKFTRRSTLPDGDSYYTEDWSDGRGIAGGWECSLNSDCGHLSQGKKSGWKFSGDEELGAGKMLSKK
jgi:transcription factor C subunit 7